MSSRARARRYHNKEKKKLNLETAATPGTSSIFDECEIEVSTNQHTDITDELYEHLREECYKRADESTSSAIKGMLRQTYGRRYGVKCTSYLILQSICMETASSCRYTLEKLSAKSSFVSTLTNRWPVFHRGEYVMVEFLSSLGEKDCKMTSMHKRATLLLQAAGSQKKTSRDVSFFC